MPVLANARIQETAEGNLVHASNQESDSLSVISAASSNRRMMAQAKLDLERCLLNEAKQETKLARLRVEAMLDEEAMVDATGQVSQSSSHRLERDLSEIIKEDRANAERVKTELPRIELEKRAAEEQYAAQQKHLMSMFEAQQAQAKIEANAEAERVVQNHIEQERIRQQIVLQEIRQKAEQEEIQAVVQFAERADEVHQAQLNQALGEAQSMGQEKLEHVLEECDQQHRKLMKNEENVLREKAQQFVANSEQHAAQELEAQKRFWEQQAPEAALSIRREAERKWAVQEAIAQAKFREQAQKIYDMEKAFKAAQEVTETHFMTVHHQRRMEQEQAQAFLVQQSEKIKELEAKLASGSAGRVADVSFSAPSPRLLPSFPKFAASSPGQSSPQIFKIDSPRCRPRDRQTKSPKEKSPYDVDDWNNLAKSKGTGSKASKREASAKSAAIALTRGNATIRSQSVSARTTPLRTSKSTTPVELPSEPPSRQSRQAVTPTSKSSAIPEKTKPKKSKKPSPTPSPPSEEFYTGVDEGEEGEEVESDFEEDEEVEVEPRKPAEKLAATRAKNRTQSAAERLLKLLQKEREEPAKKTKEAEKVNLPAIPDCHRFQSLAQCSQDRGGRCIREK